MDDVSFDTDLSPVDENVAVQILSHIDDKFGDRRDHVLAKLYPFTYAALKAAPGGRIPIARVALARRAEDYEESLKLLVDHNTERVYYWDHKEERESFYEVLLTDGIHRRLQEKGS